LRCCLFRGRQLLFVVFLCYVVSSSKIAFLVMVWFSFSLWWDRAVKCFRRDLKNIYTPLKQQNKIKTQTNYTHRTLDKINGHDTYQTNKCTHKNTTVKFQILNIINQKQEIKESHNITKNPVFYTYPTIHTNESKINHTHRAGNMIKHQHRKRKLKVQVEIPHLSNKTENQKKPRKQ